MRRRLFTIAAAISLLLCGIFVAAWLLLPLGKGYKFYSPYHEYTLRSETRGLSITVLGGRRLGGGFGTPGKHWDSSWVGATHPLPLGFWYGKSPADDPTAAFYFGLLIPFWPPAVLFTLLPCLWLHRWHFHPTCLSGQCLRCGYSLTGNVSGACPECGTPVPQQSEAAT